MVAQMVGRSLPNLDIRESNPNFCKCLCERKGTNGKGVVAFIENMEMCRSLLSAGLDLTTLEFQYQCELQPIPELPYIV